MSDTPATTAPIDETQDDYVDRSNMHDMLEAFQAEKTHVHIYLSTGIKLSGNVLDFDDVSVRLSSKVSPMLVMLSAVMTIDPNPRSE